jgi:hypothetical protein
MDDPMARSVEDAFDSMSKADGRYTHCEEVALAKTVTLPEPLNIELDTGEF